MNISTNVEAAVDRWTVQRLEVIANAAGVCSLCGQTGADTVTRPCEETLVAAHTRCVVGLGPLPAAG